MDAVDDTEDAADTDAAIAAAPMSAAAAALDDEGMDVMRDSISVSVTMNAEFDGVNGSEVCEELWICRLS